MNKKYLIGRAKASDIQIKDSQGTVSRKHLELTDLGNGFVYLKDLGATNGTYIGGFKLIPNKIYKVAKGTYISLGKNYTLKLLKVIPNHKKQLKEPTKEKEKNLSTTDSFLVGRSSEADIIILDPFKRISRRHLVVKKHDKNMFFIRDLNSANGTFVNRFRLPPEAELLVGLDDNVTLGKGYQFDLGAYLGKKVSSYYSVAQHKNEVTIVVDPHKRVTLNPNKVTLGELGEISDQEFLSLGSKPDNDLVISEDKVSRYHLKIRQLSPMIFEMIDLDSSNKTYLDGEPIPPYKKVKFRADAEVILGGSIPLDLTDHFKNVEFPTQMDINNDFPNIIYREPTPANKKLIKEFNILEKVWDDYQDRRQKILSTKEVNIPVSATAELGVKGLEAAGAIIPGVSFFILAGSLIINFWLARQKKKRLEDHLCFEDVFLETYCCPNCGYSFGFTPWAQLYTCKRCNVLYK